MKTDRHIERNRTMNVLQLRSSAGLYGADRMVLTLNGALSEAGIDSRLLSINNYRMKTQDLHAAALAGGQSADLLACSKRLDMDTLRELLASIRNQDASVIHAHDYKSAAYAWAARLRTPIRLLATLHGQVDATRALRLYNRMELTLLRRFDALAVVSERQIALLTQAGIPRHRIHLVDNGIPLKSDEQTSPPLSRLDLGLKRDSFVFAAVARFSPEKNLGMLLDAFSVISKKHRNCELMLVGDGPQADELDIQCARLGMEGRVHFTGVRDDMPAVYPHINCLVLPSLSEGMPLTVLEAMDHGIPVIASHVGEVPRLLSATDHGRVIPRADLPSLVSAMRERLEIGPEVDRSAQQHVLAHHSPAAMAQRYGSLYRSIGGSAHDVQAA